MCAPYRLAATKEPEPPDPAVAHAARLRARLIRARHVVSFVCGLVGVLSLLALAERPPPSDASARPARSGADTTTTRKIDEANALVYAERLRSPPDVLEGPVVRLHPGDGRGPALPSSAPAGAAADAGLGGTLYQAAAPSR